VTDFHIRTTCRLCHSSQLETLLKLPDTPLANELNIVPEGHAMASLTADRLGIATTRVRQDRFPLFLVGCAQCGHVQLPVVVDPKRLFPPDYPYQSGTSAVFRAHLRELAATLDTMMPDRQTVSLDIACNDGTLVRELSTRWFDAHGIDPCAPDRPQHFERAFFTAEWAANWKGGHSQGCGLVTALNVFAHVDDLDDFTRGVHTLLEPCGLFVVEVAYLPDMVARGVWDTVYHEHLSFHSLAPLMGFFARHGMTVVDAHRIDTQGGSVRIFVRNCRGQHVGGDDGHNEQSSRLKALLWEETGPDRPGIWQGVRALRESQARERKLVLSFARHHKLTGKPIAVYGAPAKLTTYLAGTQLFPDRIGIVVDDNPAKVGRYVPGTNLLIQPTSKLLEYQPTGILCASWNFAASIRERFAELGAEWYVPFEDRTPDVCPVGHRLDHQSVCNDCGIKVVYR